MNLLDHLAPRRWLRRFMIALSALAVANLFAAQTANADVGSQLNSFFGSMGGAGNATGPTAYHGQAGGYYSGGNVWIRTQDQQLTLGSLQMPSVKAGCGGIDLFTGGFSFINSAQLVAAGKAVANGALMFVFQMALKAISSLIDSTLTDQLQKLQQMISSSKSACQTGQNLAAGLFGEIGERNSQMCKSIGNSQGFFSDWAASEQGCGTGGQQASTLSQNTDKSIPTKSYNYTWSTLTTTFSSWDSAWQQYIMTIMGTIIYQVPTNDNTNGSYTFAGNGDEAVLTALLDGGTVQILKCDETTQCLNPTMQSTTIPQSSGLKSLISAELTDMVTKIQGEQKLTTQEIGLLGATSIPVFKILSVSSLSQFGGSLSAGDINALSEAIAVDMLQTLIRNQLAAVNGSTSSFQNADKTTLAQWRAQLMAVDQRVRSIQQQTVDGVTRTEMIVQRVQKIEGTIRNSLSPQLSAALAFDKAIGGSVH